MPFNEGEIAVPRPRGMSMLIPRALDALGAWVSLVPPVGDAEADFLDRLLPWERVGDLDEQRACMTALALSPGCLPGLEMPQAVRRFLADYERPHPERNLAARFAGRSEAEVFDHRRARAELTRTLRFLWPEFDGWDTPILVADCEVYYFSTYDNAYWFEPLLQPHSATAADANVGFSRWPTREVKGAMVPLPPSRWLANHDNGHVIEGSVAWAPGRPRFIYGRVIEHTGWTTKPGTVTLIFGGPGPRYRPTRPIPDRGWNSPRCCSPTRSSARRCSTAWRGSSSARASRWRA